MWGLEENGVRELLEAAGGVRCQAEASEVVLDGDRASGRLLMCQLALPSLCSILEGSTCSHLPKAH